MQDGKNPFQSPEMQQYFLSLPTLLKESIEQSGVKFQTVDELRSFVDNLNRQNQF